MYDPVSSTNPGFSQPSPHDTLPSRPWPDYVLLSLISHRKREAWDEVANLLPVPDRLYLLGCYPLSRQLDPSVQHYGFSRKSWWPTWFQLLSFPHHAAGNAGIDYAPSDALHSAIDADPTPRAYGYPRCNMWNRHSAYVVQGCPISRGEQHLTVESGTRREVFDFQSFADVPEESGGLTLVGLAGLECWIVYRAGPERRLGIQAEKPQKENMLEVEKVAVGRMHDLRERERLREMNLGRTRFVCYWNRRLPDDQQDVND